MSKSWIPVILSVVLIASCCLAAGCTQEWENKPVSPAITLTPVLTPRATPVPDCSQGLVYCRGSCRDLQWDQSHCGTCGIMCSKGYQCWDGNCIPITCPADYTLCEGKCVDLKTDTLNCRHCGKICPDNYYCSNGECWKKPDGTCGEDRTLCNNKCINLQTDPSNCGQCGNVCKGPSCKFGQCRAQ